MRTDKIRKYLILNIPYLFILWAFLKLGTAYRLAAGNDFAHTLMLPPCLVPSYRHRPMMNSYRALFHLQEDFE